MFYLIGIGLHDETDITVKGLEIVKSASKVFLEAYTSIIGKSKQDLEQFYGRSLTLADRETVEQNADMILENALNEDIALLVVGDPLGATTHTDLILRARSKHIETKVVHNASIMNAVGCCGLQLYNFGETVSIPYWSETWKPDSFAEKIDRNLKCGLHTLCLLDIQVKEPTPESLTKKVKQYLPPRFMSVNEAAAQLMDVVQTRTLTYLNEKSLCVGLARVGASDQEISACPLQHMLSVDLGKPLHSLVVVGNLHPLEKEYLDYFMCEFRNLWPLSTTLTDIPEFPQKKIAFVLLKIKLTRKWISVIAAINRIKRRSLVVATSSESSEKVFVRLEEFEQTRLVRKVCKSHGVRFA